MRDALIIDGARTPRGKGKPNGALHDIHPQELLAQVLNALVARSGFDPSDVDDVVIGNGSGDGDHGICIGRLAVLAAGWPVDAPGLTLNRFCGSGQQAVAFGAMGIRAGFQELVVAGGVESMSRWVPAAGPPDFTARNEQLRARYPLVPQGVSADLIATIEGFSRDDVDAFAVTSQERAAKAQAEGRFDGSLVPVYHPDGSLALDHDEHPRPGTTLEALASLTPAFEGMGAAVFEGFDRSFDDMCRQAYPDVDHIEHVHHGGNSSGVVDGAAAVVLASNDYAKAHGLTPRARIVMHAVAGTEPVIMLTAPGPATEKVLELARMTLDDIDLIEINEAFASVPLKTIRDLDLDPERVNVNGGAIALGHPIGATGAMLIQTALDELERRDESTALVTMCTGGGMGTATIIERV
ncbi:MAG TPA: acetyl-CoA C-acetyltransferase [Acidimicrobiia bacterium]|nr:acetyl-CoA C-acetyltransferase [Acidimicrobiia bacterium]